MQTKKCPYCRHEFTFASTFTFWRWTHHFCPSCEKKLEYNTFGKWVHVGALLIGLYFGFNAEIIGGFLTENNINGWLVFTIIVAIYIAFWWQFFDFKDNQNNE